MKILSVVDNYPYQSIKGGRDLLFSTGHPIIFHKGDTLLRPRMPFFIPEWSNKLCCEATIAVRISRVGKYIAERFAFRYYQELTVGIDITARDLLDEAIAQGRPWTASKFFDNSAVVGSWINKEELRYPTEPIELRLDYDGLSQQVALSSDMLYSIDQLIAYISKQHTLKIGDIIFTGTPGGGGEPCRIGQHLRGYLNGLELLQLDIK